MKGLSSISWPTIHLFYYRYKSFIIPSVVIAVCFLLFIAVIPRQVENVFIAKQTSEGIRQKIAFLSRNYSFLSGLSDSKVDKDFIVSSSALPPEKDFQAVLSVLSDIGADAGVTVDDYGLDIGDFSKTDSSPTLTVNLSIHGSGVQSIITFISSLQKAFPLAEVTTSTVNGGNAGVSVIFYFKEFPSLKDSNVVLKKMTKDQEELLQTLASWR